jgi:hypothetical protein
MSGATNRASGKTVTASSTITGANTLVTDGATASSSTTTIKVSGTSAWVQIDLGAIYSDIEYLQIWHYADGRTYNGTKTEVSEDGTTWITLYDSAVSGTYKELSSGKLIPVDISKTLGRTGTFIGSDGIYTGKVDASQVNTGTLSAIHITGVTMNLANGNFIVGADGSLTVKGDITGSTGTFSGNISTNSNITVGNNIKLGATDDYNTAKSIIFNSKAQIQFAKFTDGTSGVEIDGDSLSVWSPSVTFALATSASGSAQQSIVATKTNLTMNIPLVIDKAGEAIHLNGWGNSYIAYYKDNTTVRTAYVGHGSSSTNDFTIYNQVGDLILQAESSFGNVKLNSDLNMNSKTINTAKSIELNSNGAISSTSGYILVRSIANGIVYNQGLDLRVTAPSDPATYRPVRCSTVYTTGGGGLEASSWDMESLDVNTYTNMYVRPRGEFRICKPNSTTEFNSVRSSGIITGYTNFYMQVGSTGEVRIVKNGEASWSSAPSYAPIRASSFPTGSSVKWKTNIERLETEEALYMLKTTPVYTYHLQTNVDSAIYDKPKVGMLAETVPQKLRDEDGVDPYSITATLWKVVQEQQSQIESLQKSLSDLEMILGVDVTPAN